MCGGDGTAMCGEPRVAAECTCVRSASSAGAPAPPCGPAGTCTTSATTATAPTAARAASWKNPPSRGRHRLQVVGRAGVAWRPKIRLRDRPERVEDRPVAQEVTSPNCRRAPAPWPYRRSRPQVSARRDRRPPCRPAGAAHRGGGNSSVVPTPSPTARPRKAPSARFRMLSIVRDESAGACGTHPSTWASWAGVSTAPGPRASRTRRTAASGRMPSSTSSRAAIVPARPRPPRH